MNKKIIGFLFLIGVIIAGCSTRDYFGELSNKEILLFQIEGQYGSTQMSGDTIYVKIADDLYLTSLSKLSASNIKVSDFATVSPSVGEKQDFSKPVVYTVQAEDGSTKEYYVIVLRGGTIQSQIPNSSFDLWYTVPYSNDGYEEIGENEGDKTWGTGNQGAIIALNYPQNLMK